MKKIKNKKLILSSLIISSFTLPVAISCSNNYSVNSSEKIKEDDFLKSQEVKSFIESKYVENILIQKVFKITSQSLTFEIDNNQGEFYKKAKEAFDFYQKQEIRKNPSFTVKLFSDLTSKNQLTGEEINVLKSDIGPKQEFGEQSFKILYKNPYSGIKATVDKMLLVSNFLINLDTKEIKDSKRFKDSIADSNTNYNKKTIYQNINPESKDFFLKVLLLEKQPGQIWKYETSDANYLTVVKLLKIKDATSFNSLINKQELNSDLTAQIKDFELLGVNDSLNVKDLYAYKGILYNQGSNVKGDFNYNVDALKKQAKIESGFVDEKTRLIYSSDDLSSSENWKDKKILALTLKDSFDKNKNKFQLSKDDLEIKEANSHSNVTYTIERILPSETNQEKMVDVLVKMSLANGNNKSNYYYWVNVDWTNAQSVKYTPTIAENGQDLNEQFLSEIPVLNEDSTKVSATYFNKIVPLYDEEVVKNENDKTTKKVYFSLNNTPWNSDEQKQKLAYSLYLADSTSLYNDVKSFYEDLGFKISYKDEVLNQKTDNANNSKDGKK
ncbi:HinT-interacting membrane complex lipoprotein P60 [Mesomycoplasma lagogenitalium]|uniref:Lipoprotein n=1 Tax=Mesomycoplasma lagogenitalium TaxID=171286 RepID=A0ABY8LU70_9BACT|nr:hypothetical protein [Mesomycoplasma lagogenitalium]WGI36790.1 hypothetical protein QEG99_00670 [Mesomycoplasma lagogenitalium]